MKALKDGDLVSFFNYPEYRWGRVHANPYDDSRFCYVAWHWSSGIKHRYKRTELRRNVQSFGGVVRIWA